VAAAIGVIPLIACGQERGGATTAPTSLTAAGTPVTASSSVFTTKDHGGGGPVSGESRVTSLVTGTSCPALGVMLGGVKVSLTSTTVFERGACADIAVGSKLRVSGTTQSDGSVIATNVEVEVENEHGGQPVAGESRVTSLVSGTSCPALSVMLGTVKVSFTATTVFERGACADVAVGSKLRVSGTTQTDGSVVAANVEVEVENEHENEPVEGEDVITGIKAGTACPALTFLIGSKSISVTTATVFDRGTCDDLKIGARVHVKGTMTGDNVVATRIQVQQPQTPGHPVLEGDGRVSSLVAGSSCPALQFKAEEEWTVTLDASTTFVGGACADIAVGRKVGVKGTVTGEHQVLASQIVFKGPGDN